MRLRLASELSEVLRDSVSEAIRRTLGARAPNLAAGFLAGLLPHLDLKGLKLRQHRTAKPLLQHRTRRVAYTCRGQSAFDIGNLLSHLRIVFEALAQIVQIPREVANNLAWFRATSVRQIVVTLGIPAAELATDISAGAIAAELVAAVLSAILVSAVLIPAALALSGLLAVFALALSLTLLVALTLALTGLLTRLLAVLLTLLLAGLLP